MGIKGNDIAYAHLHKLFQRKGAVKRFPLRLFVLPALIQEWHDNIDAVRFAGGGGDDSFQILVVVIRRHMVQVAVHRVSEAVIADIDHKEQILAPYGFSDNSFRFACAETGTFTFNQIIFKLVAGKEGGIEGFSQGILAEPYDVIIYFLPKLPAALQSRNLKWCYRKGFFHEFNIRHDILLYLNNILHLLNDSSPICIHIRTTYLYHLFHRMVNTLLPSGRLISEGGV